MHQATTPQDPTPTPPQAAVTTAGSVAQIAASQEPEAQPARRPGWQTTEFWYVVATDVAIVAAALDGVIPAKYAALALALSKLAYGIARGLAKQGSSI